MIRIFVLLHILFAFDTWTASVLGANHRCYVCIPPVGSSISDVLQTFQESSNIPLCNQFQIGNTDYIRECPSSSYQGCLTQTNGTHVTKTCTEVGLEDCKTANKIKYCYCKGDLCNREAIPTEVTVPSETQEEEEEEDDDDEDSQSEGSGFFNTKRIETETDFGIAVIQKQLHTTTTTKSGILTTHHPEGVGIAKASTTPLAQQLYLLYLISFLLIFGFQNN